MTFTGGAGFEQASLSPDARLWSDKRPYLYDLTVQTEDDRYTPARVGIRTIAVQGQAILLNGQPGAAERLWSTRGFFASGRGLNLPLLVRITS